jgi:hypothetical protein
MGGVCSTAPLEIADESSGDIYDAEGRMKGQMSSTGGLCILLHQANLRDDFRTFVSTEWVPSEKNSNFKSYSQTNPRKIALNCVDFWTDVQDFTNMKASGFQEYRASHVYEKYIMHGCSHPVRALFCIKLSIFIDLNAELTACYYAAPNITLGDLIGSFNYKHYRRMHRCTLEH